MFPINLPFYPIKISNHGGKPRIFDDLRRRYVALTPEEWVRQHFIHYLTGHLGYPASLLANEVELTVGQKKAALRQCALWSSGPASDDHRIQGPHHHPIAEGV